MDLKLYFEVNSSMTIALKDHGNAVMIGNLSRSICPLCKDADCFHSCPEFSHQRAEEAETLDQKLERLNYNAAVDALEFFASSLLTNWRDDSSWTSASPRAEDIAESVEQASMLEKAMKSAFCETLDYLGESEDSEPVEEVTYDEKTKAVASWLCTTVTDTTLEEDPTIKNLAEHICNSVKGGHTVESVSAAILAWADHFQDEKPQT